MGDITNVDENKIEDFSMMTWGFPCTDISVAGNQKGFIDEHGNKTRSGMYYEGIRILKKKKPALSIIENVKNLTSKKFKIEFETVIKDLDEAGYNSYWKVLNAKDFGVPQNRERVFIISIRKDLDNGKFQFPEDFDNGVRLKHILEGEVDEKYYISEEKTQKFLGQLKDKDSILLDLSNAGRDNGKRGMCEYKEYSPCITARDYKDPRLVIESKNKINVIGRILPESNKLHQNQEVYSSENISPTIKATVYKDPIKVCVDKSYKNAKKLEIANCITAREDRGISNYQGVGSMVLENKVYPIGSINSSQDGVVVSPDGISKTHTSGHNNAPKVIQVGNIVEGGNFKNPQRGRVYSPDGCSPTLNTCGGGGLEPKIIDSILQTIRIRKLTPKECFRLMGFSDEDFESAKWYTENEASKIKLRSKKKYKDLPLNEKIERVSNSQLYKQSGNSIVVDVLYYILVELYKAMPYLFDNLKLSSFFSGIGAFEVALDRLYESINSGNFTRLQVERR